MEKDKEYPEEVQQRIAILDLYEWNEELDTFDILHLYPKELAYPNGYYSARFFELIGFSTKTLQKRNLGRHDAIIYNDKIVIDIAQIFADGSTLLRFESPILVGLPYLQTINFFEAKTRKNVQ